MPKIHYDYFECPETDCPNRDPEAGLPCVIQIAEGERRRCPCERKIKLSEGNRVAPPEKSVLVGRKSLMLGGGGLILVLLLILVLIPGSPAIEIEDSMLRFEPTREGGESRRLLSVSNVGKGTLTIHSASASPSVFAVVEGDQAITVKKGETVEIAVLFKPAQGAPTEGTLVVASNDSKAGPQEVELVGSVAIGLDDALRVFDELDSTAKWLNPK
jgi:hypothetical protein